MVNFDICNISLKLVLLVLYVKLCVFILEVESNSGSKFQPDWMRCDALVAPKKKESWLGDVPNIIFAHSCCSC
jgi:hypothetical protein